MLFGKVCPVKYSKVFRGRAYLSMTQKPVKVFENVCGLCKLIRVT